MTVNRTKRTLKINEIEIVRQYTGWARSMAEAAIEQWKSNDPGWNAGYIECYLVRNNNG